MVTDNNVKSVHNFLAAYKGQYFTNRELRERLNMPLQEIQNCTIKLHRLQAIHKRQVEKRTNVNEYSYACEYGVGKQITVVDMALERKDITSRRWV